MPNRNETPYPLVGTLYRVRFAFERFPHFVFDKGAVGLVVEAKDNLIRLRMFEEPMDGSAEEWDNEIVWTDEPDTPGQFHNDCKQVAYAHTFATSMHPVYIPYCDYRKNQQAYSVGRTQPLFLATMDGGRYELTALGFDPEHASTLLRQGWIQHCEKTGADISYCFPDNTEVRAFRPGTCHFDGKEVAL